MDQNYRIQSSGVTSMATDSGKIRELLYPAEWAFRFFIGVFLVWIASNMTSQPDSLFVVGYYMFAAGVCVALVWQVVVLVNHIRDR
jgi:hypothetical protein